MNLIILKTKMNWILTKTIRHTPFQHAARFIPGYETNGREIFPCVGAKKLIDTSSPNFPTLFIMLCKSFQN